jgi:polyhydroxyalkanoate synthesis regulator phasin
MSPWYNEYSWRECHEAPENLSDAELSRAEEFWRENVRRYPRGWAAISKLNDVIAERERRERARATLDAAREIREAAETVRSSLEDLSSSVESDREALSDDVAELTEELRALRERMDEIQRKLWRR